MTPSRPPRKNRAAVQNDAAAQSQAEPLLKTSAETGTEATSDAGDGENVEA